MSSDMPGVLPIGSALKRRLGIVAPLLPTIDNPLRRIGPSRKKGLGRGLAR
jgi:hypothetical protein